MAQEPLVTKGNFLHIYDFRVQKGHEEEFIKSFEEFDYSDGNPMHKSKAQVKDGVLCRDTQDPQLFCLIAEWADIDEHARIRKVLANEIKPEFIKYIEGGKFIPKYVEVVLSTPDEILNKAAGCPCGKCAASTRFSGLRLPIGCASRWLSKGSTGNRATSACRAWSTARRTTSR